MTSHNYIMYIIARVSAPWIHPLMFKEISKATITHDYQDVPNKCHGLQLTKGTFHATHQNVYIEGRIQQLVNKVE